MERGAVRTLRSHSLRSIGSLDVAGLGGLRREGIECADPIAPKFGELTALGSGRMLRGNRGQGRLTGPAVAHQAT